MGLARVVIVLGSGGYRSGILPVGLDVFPFLVWALWRWSGGDDRGLAFGVCVGLSLYEL